MKWCHSGTWWGCSFPESGWGGWMGELEVDSLSEDLKGWGVGGNYGNREQQYGTKVHTALVLIFCQTLV